MGIVFCALLSFLFIIFLTDFIYPKAIELKRFFWRPFLSSSPTMSLVTLVVGWTSLFIVLELIRRNFWGSSSSSSSTASPSSSNVELKQKVSSTWNRPFQVTALAADLPRLARKVYIHLPSKQYDPEDDVVPALKQLFTVVIGYFEGESAKTAIDEAFRNRFNEEVLANIDLAKVVADYLGNHIQPYTRSLDLFKTISQDMIAAAVIKLKFQFMPMFPFKDIRGNWYIHLHFDDPSVVRVIHKKREQSFENTPNKQFEFQWELSLEFDTSISTLTNVDLYITDINISPLMEDSNKSKIIQMMQPYIRPTTTISS